MNALNCRLTIHMACSLDVFIAKKDGSVSWMETEDRDDNGASFDDAGDLIQ